jgi:hypothetical protein
MNSYRETFNSVKQTLVLGDSIIIKKDDVTDGKSVWWTTYRENKRKKLFV